MNWKVAKSAVACLLVACCGLADQISVGQLPQVPVPVPQPIPVPVPQPIAAKPNYFMAVELHYDRLINYAMDHFGRTRSGALISSLDPYTTEMAEQSGASDWRMVPGSQIYWDQPSLLAAYEVGKRSGCKCYDDSATAYIRSYLHQTTGHRGKEFPLGNEVYLNALNEKITTIQATAIQLTGRLHHTPAWELFYAVDKVATRKTLVSFVDKNAHDLAGKSSALSSLCWIAQQDGEDKDEWTAKARKLVGSVKAEPSSDNVVAFSRWCRTLARCAKQTEDGEIDKAAQQALDQLSGLKTQSGSPSVQLQVLFDQYEAKRIRGMDVGQLIAKMNDLQPKLQAAQLTARDYARLIRFYWTAAELNSEATSREIAKKWADRAIAKLYLEDSNMFRSRDGVDRCDAADGPGWLFLALMSLDGDDVTVGSAMSF